MRKNDELEVVIQNLGANGEGVALLDNMPVFIPFALQGEKVKIRILKVLKNFAYAKLLSVSEPSKDRVEAPCPYFKKCGGCQLQHLNYEKQLEFKKQLVQNNLKKFGNIDFEVNDCISSNNHFEYRNKFQLPTGEIGGNNVLGMYATASHRIVPITSCMLHGEWSTVLIKIVLDYINEANEKCYDENTKKGNIRHIVARYLDGKLMLTIVTKQSKILKVAKLIKELEKQFANFSLYQNINKKDSNVILGDEFVLLYGEPAQKLQNFGIKYEVSPQSFLQVNYDIQNKIYRAVLDSISKDMVVVDAYSGAGLLSAIISKNAKYVYGIEIVEKATENANKLANDNQITNMININGDCANELPILVEKLTSQNENNLAVVLDPPRKGCDERVLESIKQVLPQKIIYVSCNSATLSRDLKILLSGENYQIESITPFDMFPQTCHIETMAVLTKKR